ncbi:hypothetical protein ZWY2020_020251 [Hordeum vulgare]|nr:hypothetical protein ZWY2020_020251 [Hordeum vulgare]
MTHVEDEDLLHGETAAPQDAEDPLRESNTCMALVACEGERSAGDMGTQQDVLESTQQGMTMQEAVAFAKLKVFCSCIVKKLAPSLLREVQASTLHPDVETFMPGHTTRAAKRTAGLSVPKASRAENVLLRTLGLVAEDLEVDDQAVKDLRGLFDSPLHEQHIKVLVVLFGKAMPIEGELGRKDVVLVGA